MTFDPQEPLFPPGFPEEFKEQILEHRRTTLAHTQDNTHAVRMLLEDLNQDQLEALDLLVSAVMVHPEYDGGYFRGQITQLLHIKYDMCPCGLDHDPTKSLQLPEVTRPGSPVMPNEDTALKGRPIEDVEIPPELNKQLISTPDNEVVEIKSDRWDELLVKYNLIAVFDYIHDAERLAYVQCKGCQTTYVSLRDRMLKPPGVKGCEGCQQQEKWG